MFNKRGDTISDHLVLWIPKFVYLAIALLTVIFLIRLLIVTHIDTSEAEARIFANRIFYSPNVISYFDSDIGRSYPGIIDFSKFKKLQESDLNEMDTKTITYGGKNGIMAAKLTLKDIETNLEEVVFYNKENYDFWEPRALNTVIGGSGSVKSIEEQRYVLVKNNAGIKKGSLKLNIIVRK